MTSGNAGAHPTDRPQPVPQGRVDQGGGGACAYEHTLTDRGPGESVPPRGLVWAVSVYIAVLFTWAAMGVVIVVAVSTGYATVTDADW